MLETSFHPLSRIFERCRDLDYAELPEVLAAMRRCIADRFEQVPGALSLRNVKFKLSWLRAVSLHSGSEANRENSKNCTSRMSDNLWVWSDADPFETQSTSEESL